jgi:type VI secretion system protein ImpI
MPVALMVRVLDTQANQHVDRTFEDSPVNIGRHPLNELHLDHPYLSQFHAAIEIRDKRIFVRDLGSANGTVHADQRLPHDQPVEVTAAPEIILGPLVVRLSLVDQPTKQPVSPGKGDFDIDVKRGNPGAKLADLKPIPPAAEDALIRQLVPYIEAHRTSWGAVYRVIHDHVTRLPPELRTSYLKRLGREHPSLNLETDFQKLAQYFGVDPVTLGELSPPQASYAALAELARTLAPGSKPPEDVPEVLAFARRLRDTLEVFLKCSVALRDGYQELQKEMPSKDSESVNSNRVATAKDAKELGNVLLGPDGGPDAPRKLYDVFVEVMSHQVALLDGVTEGVKTLLECLSPKAIEDELEKGSRPIGLFSNKYEALWELYKERHGDYSGGTSKIFQRFFGPRR